MLPILQSSLTQTQRLQFAGAAAISFHLLLFVTGLVLIKQISIPASENRVMVLTLESTPSDGLLERQDPVEETLQDARTGMAESFSAEQRSQRVELSQLSSIPHPKATFDLNPEFVEEPLPESESVSWVPQDTPPINQVELEQTPSAAQALESQLAEPSSRQLDESANELSEFDLSVDDMVLGSIESLELPTPRLQISSTPDEQIDIAPKQQTMLERKIQQWATKIGSVEQVDQTYSWRHKGQTYQAKFTHLPATGAMDLDEMLVEVTTVEDGQALSTTMRLKKLAFSNFAQFVHRWDPMVIIHDDQLNGRFHSNSQILLSSDRDTRPVFHGKVTTASSRVEFADAVRRSTRREIFQGGLETGVKRIRMPKPQMLFAESVGSDADDTITFDTDTRLVFTPEGGFMWHPTKEAGAPRYQVLPDHPIYLVADSGVTLSVSGKVLGKVMVYSPERIIIEDDLTYARANFMQSEDMIGLISGKSVVIGGQETTGEGDLNVQASIYARGRFHVRDYSKRHTGTLKIFGSVSAGTISATQPRYATDIKFDSRFERIRPPGFPVTERYEVTDKNLTWSKREL